MRVSTERAARRRRYVRQPASRTCTLTPTRAAILQRIAEFRIISLPQLARLLEISEKAARRHCRELFDGGLVSVVPVSRFALADPAASSDPALIHGSAPNLYVIASPGVKALRARGWEGTVVPPPRSGPGSIFLGHELGVRDTRIWLELATRRYEGHHLEVWRDGGEAELPLGRGSEVERVRPDAWFVYRLGGRLLVGLVETDRGTERGSTRWKQKLRAYAALYEGDRLRQALGYANARVLVTTPDARRRDSLAELVREHAPADLVGRFWLAEQEVLAQPDLSTAVWRQPGLPQLRPLIPAELVTPISRTKGGGTEQV